MPCLRFSLTASMLRFMRLLLTAAILLVCVVIWCPAAQTNAPDSVANRLVVRLLNGKNGKPIKHETLGARLDKNRQANVRTDQNGEVVLAVGEAEPRAIRIWLVNFFIDCGTYGDDGYRETQFSIDEIASKGIVAENRCGQDRANPTPGVLIVYARKMTSKEKRLI